MLRTSSFRRAAAMRRELSGVAARASTALSRGGGEEQDSLWAPLLVLAGASSTLAAIALLQQDEKAKATPRELPPAEEPALLPPSRRNMNRFPAVGNLAAPLWVLPTTQCDFYMPEAGGSPMQLGRKGTLEWMDRTASRRVSLKSKYNLGHELGVGSFGAVIAATCRANGQGVAIKRLPKEFTSSTAVQRELQALLRIQAAGGHPNLCGLHEHFDEGPDYSLVLDLVSGGELFEALCRDGPMYEADAARLICQMSSALAFMHSLGTVHADLKPENVMLSTEETDTAQVKIVDFGCSQSILESQQEAQSSSPTRRLFGSKSKPVASAEGARPGTAITPAYCPPEVLAELRKGSHAPPIATAYDMWSLGAILFVMLTGTHPFDMQGRGTDEEIASNILDSRLVTQKPAWQAEITDLSEDVQALLRGLLEPDPSKRLTAADLLQSPWVRGLTASSQKVHEADHRMAAYRKHKTKVAAQFFKSMLQHTDTHGDSMDARKTSLLEAAFSKLDTKNRGYISSKELHGDNSLFGSDARLNIAEAQELLSQTSMKETYFPAGHSIYREGDRGDIMYFVHSGTVRAESATDGFVKIKGTGEFFGEDVLNEETSEDSPRYAFTATTLTPVHAIQISRVDYDKYVKADEDLALSMKENGRLRRRERARVLLGMERQLKHRDYFRGDM
jgi:serine/threonine protein kinase